MMIFIYDISEELFFSDWKIEEAAHEYVMHTQARSPAAFLKLLFIFFSNLMVNSSKDSKYTLRRSIEITQKKKF